MYFINIVLHKYVFIYKQGYNGVITNGNGVNY